MPLTTGQGLAIFFGTAAVLLIILIAIFYKRHAKQVRKSHRQAQHRVSLTLQQYPRYPDYIQYPERAYIS
jgi:hypothetical protein